MKKAVKIILVVVLILFVAYNFAQFKLKTLLAQELSKVIKREVFIGKVGINPFSGVYLKNLIIFEPGEKTKDLKEFVRVDKIVVSPAILSLLQGKLALNAVSLVRPVINITKTDRGEFNFSDSPIVSGAGAEKPKAGNKRLLLLVAGFRIIDGQFNYTDTTVKENPVEIKLKDINFGLKRFILPATDTPIEFNLKAKAREGNLPGLAQINATGSLNLVRKDMNAKFNLSNLDLTYLEPYYRRAVSGEIKSGTVGFSSDIVSLANSLTAKCKLEIADFKIIPPQDTEATILGVPVVNIVDALKDKDNKLVLDFEIKTNFDRPRINLSELGGEILSKAMTRAIFNSPEIILNIGGKSGETSSEDIKKELQNIGEGLKQILGK
ncbi:MAG: DUF748 domain-containing protein [Candidatus Omnitrophica bacterium]|nr:DUF748 domain-containing protein [Candidatus Omnitrophota bacterium]